MLNQHHKSQLRGKKKVVKYSVKSLKLYSWKTLSEFEVQRNVKEFRASTSTVSEKKLSKRKRSILEYQTVNIKPMRIKRESPCLGLRFMPIKLSEFQPDVTSQILGRLRLCLCVSLLQENHFSSLLRILVSAYFWKNWFLHLFTIIT